jgi:hypothetical protein
MTTTSIIDQLTEQCPKCGHLKICHTSNPGEYATRCADGCDCAYYDAPVGSDEPASPRTLATPALVDFLTALRSGRPFRRRIWVVIGPTADPMRADFQDGIIQHNWIYPRTMFPTAAVAAGLTESIFVNLMTGRICSPTLSDLLATDWESMP